MLLRYTSRGRRNTERDRSLEEASEFGRRLLALTQALDDLRLDLVTDRCDAQENACQTRCAEERTHAILMLQPARSECQLHYYQAMTACHVEHHTDPQALAQCQQEAADAYRVCLAPIERELRSIDAAHTACVDDCASRAAACRLPDHEPPAPDPPQPDPSHPDITPRFPSDPDPPVPPLAARKEL